MTVLNGSCHCGAVHVQLEPGKPLAELPLRACQCEFCRRQGGRTTSHPDSRLHITAAPGALHRYRFGRRQVDFLICRECACYVAAMIEHSGEAYATLNVVGTALPGFDGREPERLDYHDETDEQRLARRKAKWTPTTLVEAVPNA
jgi:hypothetical protein